MIHMQGPLCNTTGGGNMVRGQELKIAEKERNKFRSQQKGFNEAEKQKLLQNIQTVQHDFHQVITLG